MGTPEDLMRTSSSSSWSNERKEKMPAGDVSLPWGFLEQLIIVGRCQYNLNWNARVWCVVRGSFWSSSGKSKRKRYFVHQNTRFDDNTYLVSQAIERNFPRFLSESCFRLTKLRAR